MHSLATRVHINTPSRWAEAHKGANSARRNFLVFKILDLSWTALSCNERISPGDCGALLVCC
jgi:hypothetical protein